MLTKYINFVDIRENAATSAVVFSLIFMSGQQDEQKTFHYPGGV
ncbi:hypothetical protein KDK_82160 [Dictyobacter kobayashii]|uniref:Uncharacterized protein n=1 Tax=Dictyobacter kobayashii TaxID=2014872 RepID=A0A402AZ74_9CHLR|nr:hypothetical protein KDK_82160 [Dictyobacter kobayashii]